MPMRTPLSLSLMVYLSSGVFISFVDHTGMGVVWVVYNFMKIWQIEPMIMMCCHVKHHPHKFEEFQKFSCSDGLRNVARIWFAIV